MFSIILVSTHQRHTLCSSVPPCPAILQDLASHAVEVRASELVVRSSLRSQQSHVIARSPKVARATTVPPSTAWTSWVAKSSFPARWHTDLCPSQSCVTWCRTRTWRPRSATSMNWSVPASGVPSPKCAFLTNSCVFPTLEFRGPVRLDMPGSCVPCCFSGRCCRQSVITTTGKLQDV